MNNAINTDLKNKFARLYHVFCFFDSSQIQFYLSCITIIIIKEEIIQKYFQITDFVHVGTISYKLKDD